MKAEKKVSTEKLKENTNLYKNTKGPKIKQKLNNMLRFSKRVDQRKRNYVFNKSTGTTSN